MRLGRLAVAAAALMALGACSSDEPAVDDSAIVSAGVAGEAEFVDDIDAAIAAVEAELGASQRYFEITANPQLTNIFVAVDDETAVVPYLFIDGELQPPAPKQTGANGHTFAASDVDIDGGLVAERFADELPNTAINAVSVYGDGFGATYVVAGRSEVGGLLDIVVTGDGQIVSVDPI
ncbi:hypothetical protein [Ilumatobacter coccineus]|uniref:PepSY domain-containing protein n=1 Tax=Ilumatobacter coccineus (strain NBRC 103263 / KCTC 29153 / YM16-304) TaxID=1313172 RepID=A0A6C7ED77_ILUCY|nr:hypothetical protein [Ilumatobacter coccineus]BAN01956.1 hypothetical protein YM304_16420 [Ilumatobacter coccineus YM16-304]